MYQDNNKERSPQSRRGVKKREEGLEKRVGEDEGKLSFPVLARESAWKKLHLWGGGRNGTKDGLAKASHVKKERRKGRVERDANEVRHAGKVGRKKKERGEKNECEGQKPDKEGRFPSMHVDASPR